MGGTDTRFCSLPLVPLVGERIVTILSLSCHSTVTTWGVLLCISFSTWLCNPHGLSTPYRSKLMHVRVHKRFVGSHETCAVIKRKFPFTNNKHKLVCWEESITHNAEQTSYSALMIVAKEMVYQSWASAWCASTKHCTLRLRSVCQRNSQLDYRLHWLYCQLEIVQGIGVVITPHEYSWTICTNLLANSHQSAVSLGK